MPRPLFKGVITALVTPFRHGTVDEAALAALVERQIAAGVRPRAGRPPQAKTATLSRMRSTCRVISLCIEETGVAGRVPVVAGAGSNSTAEAIEFVRHAKAAGAQAASS